MAEQTLTLQVLQTKLHVPAVRSGRVVRPRLLARLDEGLALGHRLFLVSAPAGFGKTTVVSDWLAHLAGRPPAARPQPAWLTLDARDNDPYRFWRYVLEALRGVLPGLGETIRASLLSHAPGAIEVLVGELINEVSAAGRPVLLVLDDYHQIHSPEVHENLAYFIEHLPDRFCLLIATRSDPDLPLARLRSRFLLTEVREADLRFAPDETQRFLLETSGLRLSESEVAALEARTEGWVAGLQLAALALQGALAQGPAGRVPAIRVEDFLRTFGGSHRFVLDYLSEEVLRHQPPEVVEFLTRSSALDQLSAELVEAVIDDRPGGEAGGRAPRYQRLLEQLERDNLFIVPLDHDRRWYRYHALFTGFLRARLAEREPGLAQILHRRAAAWYARRGEPETAVDYALRGEDYQQAARLMELAVRERVILPRHWLSSLPEDMLRARPLLCVNRAMELQLSGPTEGEEVLDWCDLAEKALASPDLEEDEDYHSVVQGHILLTRASYFNQNLSGEKVEQAVYMAAQALEAFPEDEWPALSSAAVSMTNGYRLMGNIPAARESIDLVWKFARASGSFARIFVAAYIQADLAFTIGSLVEARDASLEALRLASESPGQRGLSVPEAGGPYISLAQVHLSRGELDKAEESLNQGMRLVQMSGQLGIAIDGWLDRVHLYSLLHNQARAEEALVHVARIFPNFPLLAQAMQAWIWLACLDESPELAGSLVDWVDSSEKLANYLDTMPPEKLIRHSDFMAMVVLLRVMVALHERGIPSRQLVPLASLTRYLDNITSYAGRVGLWGIASDLQPLHAQSLDLLGERALALEVVEAVMARNAAEENMYGFMLCRPGIAGLVEEALRQGRQPDFAARILAVLRRLSPADRRAGGAGEDSYEALSERELEVLRLLSAGYANREIAETLYLAEGTVKKHVSNILGKLGVDSRARAVNRARELGLTG